MSKALPLSAAIMSATMVGALVYLGPNATRHSALETGTTAAQDSPIREPDKVNSSVIQWVEDNVGDSVRAESADCDVRSYSLVVGVPCTLRLDDGQGNTVSGTSCVAEVYPNRKESTVNVKSLKCDVTAEYLFSGN